MTPTEALELLDAMAAATAASRGDHVRAQEAVRVLAETLKERDVAPATPVD